MGYWEFYDLDWRSFQNKMRGYQARQTALSRERWEIMRVQLSWLINIQLPKKDRLKPAQFFSFPDEKTKAIATPAPLTEAELKAKFDKVEAFVKEKYFSNQKEV